MSTNRARRIDGSADGSATVEIRNFAFNPEELTVQPGTDDVDERRQRHTQRQSDDGSFASPDLDSGAVLVHVQRARHVPYICGIHTSMHGTIVVEG